MATVRTPADLIAPLRYTPEPRPPRFKISERAGAIPQALSIQINQLVYDRRRRGEDVIVLSLGEAFFDIPLYDFATLDVAKGYHYSDSQGIPELRRKIAEYYAARYRATVDPDRELLVTAGSKAAIFMAMQATLDPGDELLIHEPAWLSYQEQARLVGATPRFIPFDCAPDGFGGCFGPRTRMLVINNPNNPAGRVYSRAELTAIREQCRERGVYLLVDEAYSDFVLDGSFASLAELAPDRAGVIVVNSLSKNLGMSGWRVGYTIAHPELLRHLLKLNQHLLTCGPTILLHYLARYFEDILAVTLPQVRQVVEKRERVARMMDALGLRRLEGASTFYFFVSIDEFPGSDMEFALSLLMEHGVAVVPGSAYGASTGRYVRVSVGTESEERLARALRTMRDLIRGGYDRSRLEASLAAAGVGH
jgi:aspartate aminotransferase/aminotransferase